MTDRGARMALRAATRDEHERLDARMAGFDLADRDAYRAFLTAHAAALAPVEAALDAAGFADECEDWPARRRTRDLAADLTALDAAMPAPLPFAPLADAAACWGAAYVLEGSRLGGAMLARAVGTGFPSSYLGTPQAPGAWRGFVARLETALSAHRDVETAGRAARSVFALFDRAARDMEPD